MSADLDPTARIVAATLRVIAGQYEGNPISDDLRGIAQQVEIDWDGACCPLCQEVTCDDGCPLEAVRAALAEGVASERSGERWTSVFFRYQREFEETHASLEDALAFLYDGWCTAERSPVAVKGPDGQIVMDADQIIVDRQNRAPKES
ncbi:hypothetical protein [Streptosporangium vulgare]|uniref:4Fe-4S ferredoxin-type domain-containing protein n=1 Tax=Streptosporangium vulgare TaxID=46190 RepID=A0ABV5TQ40_9ACTN